MKWNSNEMFNRYTNCPNNRIWAYLRHFQTQNFETVNIIYFTQSFLKFQPEIRAHRTTEENWTSFSIQNRTNYFRFSWWLTNNDHHLKYILWYQHKLIVIWTKVHTRLLWKGKKYERIKRIGIRNQFAKKKNKTKTIDR